MFEKKNQSLFVMNATKLQLKNSDVDAKAQGEDIKRATSCCLTRNETQQNNSSLHFVFLGSS